jgi:hypothetical protein
MHLCGRHLNALRCTWPHCAFSGYGGDVSVLRHLVRFSAACALPISFPFPYFHDFRHIMIGMYCQQNHAVNQSITDLVFIPLLHG